MTSHDPLAEMQEKLDRLIELRKKEEEEYGKLLTLLDQRSAFPLPEEASHQLQEIKESLNQIWDVSKQAYSAASVEDRIFWKEVAKNTARYIEPFVQQQREFNSQLVHLVNEFVQSVSSSFAGIRDFQNSLILYFQRIVPMVDTKFREMVGVEDRNVLTNLQKFQENLLKFQEQIHNSARDHADLLYQELDKRVITLQVDSKEQDASVNSLQTSLRSLHHLANAWKSAKAAGKQLSLGEEHRYYHFEEDFRGSRTDIKEKFVPYVKYFSANLQAPVLDLGCGRGEFLELLKEAAIPGIGVDSNENMVQSCRELGLDVSQGDLLEFLVSQQEDSLGGIFCSQVVEHLPPDVLMKLLDAAYARMKDGATILLETVNIASAFAFLQVYTKDLTHRTPIHPETLKFLVTACGFQKVEILYTSPMPAVSQLKLFQNPSDEAQHIFNQNMVKLNRLLFDPQEYAVLATK